MLPSPNLEFFKRHYLYLLTFLFPLTQTFVVVVTNLNLHHLQGRRIVLALQNCWDPKSHGSTSLWSWKGMPRSGLSFDDEKTEVVQWVSGMAGTQVSPPQFQGSIMKADSFFNNYLSSYYVSDTVLF